MATRPTKPSIPAFNSKKAGSIFKAAAKDIVDHAKTGQFENLRGTQTASISSLSASRATILNQQLIKSNAAITKELALIAQQQAAQNTLAKKLGEYHEKVLDGQEALNEKFETLEEQVSKFKQTTKEVVEQATTSFGKKWIAHLEKKLVKKETESAKEMLENKKDIEKALAAQFLEVSEMLEKTNDTNLQYLKGDLADALKAVQKNNFEAYRKLSKNLEDVATNYHVSDQIESRLKGVEQAAAEMAKFQKDRRDKYLGYADKAGSKIFGAMGLGSIYSGAKTLGNLAGKAYRAPRRIKEAIQLHNYHRNLKKSLKSGNFFGQPNGPTASNVLPFPGASLRNQDAANDQTREQNAGDSGLLSRQVSALETIAKQSKKGASNDASFSPLKRSLFKGTWQLLKKFGGSLFKGVGGLLMRGLAFIGPALSAIAGPLATVAAAAAVGYATYKAASWIMEKLNIDPGKIGTSLYDATHGDVNAQEDAKLKEHMKEFSKTHPPRVTEGDTSKTLSQAAAQASSTVPMATPSTSDSGGGTPTVAPVTSSVASSSGGDSGAGALAGGGSLKSGVGKLFNVAGGVNLDGVNPGVQSNFTAMTGEFKQRGGSMPTINSAFRSYAEQAALYAADPKKAAPPGKSAHGTGLAIDINSKEANQMDSMGLLSKYGFSRPVKGEAWHIQATGTAAALAKAGGISADSSTDQASASSGGTVATQASPVTEKVPAAPVQVTAEADAPGKGSEGGATVTNLNKGSTQTIPTMSFMDSGFFVMNTGMLTG